MSLIATKSKFHCALDGIGLLLQGAPDRLSYNQGQAPIYGQRFASGDRDYNDLSQWWYFVQTDFSGGIKDSLSWADDARFYYSTNIDSWSEVGSIKLCRKQYPGGAEGDNDFTDEIGCGIEGEVNGVVYKFVGSGESSDARPHIYRSATGEDAAFTDISGTTIGTNQNIIAQMSANSGILWASTVGVGSTWVVLTYNGTTFTDQSAFIYNGGATITFQPLSSRCHTTYAGVTYVLVDDSFNNKYAMVKTSVANPSAAANWSKAFEVSNNDGIPIACIGFNGKIYYLTNHSGFMQLWAYDISSGVNTLIQKFNSTNAENWSVGDKLMVLLNGELIITIPDSEIWKHDGTSLSRIFVKDTYKKSFTSQVAEADCYLHYGCVIQDNKAWWGNLMYDSAKFYNTWKNDADSLTNKQYPLFGDSGNRIWETHTGDNSVLWSVNLFGDLYKGTADKNFLVLSNLDKVSGVEKLAYSTTILFKPLASGQSIIIEYLTGELTATATWTVLGTASATLDGTSVNSKTFFFPDATVFNKIWFRVKFTAGGGTPTLTDVVTEYIPVPTFKKTWSINVNASDSIKMLNGGLNESTGRELRALLEHKWWTKSTLDFQDLDYATTIISDNPLSSSATTITVPNGGTSEFPEQGRLRVENEEIFYTGKTPIAFTGCTRGVRGTRATSHAQNSVINNAYNVIITNLQTTVPVALQDKDLEYIVGISLREV